MAKDYGKVIRVGPKFAKTLRFLQDDYSKAVGKRVKMTKLTDNMTDRLAEEGLIARWIQDARRRQR